MNERDLERALEPVREYFSGRELNDNTVLAAYLRSRGWPASGQPWLRAKRALAATGNFADAVAAAAARPAEDAPLEPIARNDEPSPFSGASLDWFPKQFGPGDLDGVGAKRLLGTPDLEPAWVLVRETAQNSWDARGAAPSVDFTLNLRELDQQTITLLRERIFVGDAPKTGLRELLCGTAVWALEVSDRGTVGLGGPIRNDLAVDPGEDTNFIDLVFNVGAPRDVHLGGGTYGFGKTITYGVSEVGTVLIWSRCEGPRGLESRLIGSAIGDAFERDGYRYTGRHWWGNAIADEGRIEPLVGDLAQHLGGQVFSEGFAEGDTGTSMLILAPRLGGRAPEDDVDALVEAIVRNLWPKLMIDQDGRSRMRIRLQLNGRDVELPQVETHETLSGHVDCLRVVRALQAGRDLSTLDLAPPVMWREVRSDKPRKLLGHLALVRYPIPRGTADFSRSVTLMRNQAELVVTDLRRSALDVDGYQWAGVFKPVADVDDSFALAEPPAHDDWIPKAVQDKQKRRDVNVALDRVRSLTDDFIRPTSGTPASAEPLRSAAVAGDALAGLLGGLLGSGPDGRVGPSGGGGRHASRPRVDVIASGTTDSTSPGWTRTWLDVQMTDAGMGAQVADVKVLVGVDGGSEHDAHVIRVLGWLDPTTGLHTADATTLDPDDVRRFEFESRADLAIDVDPRILEP